MPAASACSHLHSQSILTKRSLQEITYMEPEPYAYQKLMADQIRILHVRAATTWHEEISCHLITVSLEDSPQFEALSYVWGDAKDTFSIQLKGGVLPVTRNLEAAIRRLRMKTEERVIWIDQLCINQADAAEKSIQVAMMPRIYKSCKEVILWLGEIEAVNEITVEDALTCNTNMQGVAAAGMAIIQEFIIRRGGLGLDGHPVGLG